MKKVESFMAFVFNQYQCTSDEVQPSAAITCIMV